MTLDPERWASLVDGTACPMCRDSAREPTVTLRSGRVDLQDDADFPGYCILVCRRHVTEIHDLDADEVAQFARDVSRLSAAISSVCRPAKINVAILGNEVPHLHCHVIPRFPGDGWWGKPIWARPASERRSLSQQEYDVLAARLRDAVSTDTE